MDEVIALVHRVSLPFLQITTLGDLYIAYKSLPLNYILAGHCLFAATMAPDFKQRFLLHFWVTFLAGFGGGILSSILMMDPVKAPINILANNAVGVTWSVCWWLMTYAPFNIFGRIHSLLPVRMVTKACVTFMRANLIVGRVDLAVAMFPGVIAAPLILGTIAGSGGKLITDGIRGGWGVLPGTAEASAPSFVWRSAALAAAGYWGACKFTNLLTSQEAAAVVITVLLAHSILSDLLGAAVTDFTYPVARVAHTLSLVPMPAAAAVSPAATKAAKKTSEPAKQATPAAGSGTNSGTQKQQQTNVSAAAAVPGKGSSGKNNAPGVAVKADSSNSKGGKKAESKKSK